MKKTTLKKSFSFNSTNGQQKKTSTLRRVITRVNSRIGTSRSNSTIGRKIGSVKNGKTFRVRKKKKKSKRKSYNSDLSLKDIELVEPCKNITPFPEENKNYKPSFTEDDFSSEDDEALDLLFAKKRNEVGAENDKNNVIFVSKRNNAKSFSKPKFRLDIFDSLVKPNNDEDSEEDSEEEEEEKKSILFGETKGLDIVFSTDEGVRTVPLKNKGLTDTLSTLKRPKAKKALSDPNVRNRRNDNILRRVTTGRSLSLVDNTSRRKKDYNL